MGLLSEMCRGVALPARDTGRPDRVVGPAAGRARAVRVYFIKPSRYDDDGLVLRYRWGVIPNNTLIVLAGLNEDFARRRPDIEVQTVLWDEMVDGILTGEVLRSIRQRATADQVEPIIGLAGVQTNQYPRARDIALQCRGLDLPVLIGGFHVSSDEPTQRFLVSVGVTVVVGEAESTWPVILDDYLGSRLKPSYRVTDGLSAKTGIGRILVPEISATALPAIEERYLGRFFNPTFSTIDTSRGCPFVCSYCSVKNVMGRTMRPRDPRAVVDWIRDAHDRHGVRNLLIVDDDLYRSPVWEEVLSGMAELRREGRDISCIIQTDIEASVDAWPEAGKQETARHRESRKFVELAASAGCFEAFVGLESFDPANLEGAAKFHNEERQDRRRGTSAPAGAALRVKGRYARAVSNWHRAGVGVHAGYIIGMPFDRPGCGRRAARDLTEIGVDIASFFAYTPLPGTEEYVQALADGSLVSVDFNEYDSTHFVRRHPLLGFEQLRREYDDAYRSFYTWKRLAWSLGTLHRVRGLTLAARNGMMAQQAYFTYASRAERHPMMGGIWRLREGAARRQVWSDQDALRRYLPASGVPRRIATESADSAWSDHGGPRPAPTNRGAVSADRVGRDAGGMQAT